MKILYGLLILTVLSAGVLFFQNNNTNTLQSSNKGYQAFQQFKQDFNKDYSEKEETYRYEMFLQNLQYIEETNKNAGKRVVKLNQTADMSQQEYIARYLNETTQKNSDNLEIKKIEVDVSDYPTSLDWLSEGVVPDVVDAKSCTASYAVASAASLASVYAIETGKLENMSTQQIVSCDTSSGGCRGGYYYYSLLYAMQNGIQSDASYPYTGRTGSCEYNKEDVVFTPTDALKIQYENTDVMMQEIQNQPLIAEIDASQSSFRFYSGDDVYHSFCYADFETNYSVLLTGYNDDDEMPYWILQASYGTGWGDNGYMKIKKEMKGHGMCGINTNVGFPAYKK